MVQHACQLDRITADIGASADGYRRRLGAQLLAAAPRLARRIG